MLVLRILSVQNPSFFLIFEMVKIYWSNFFPGTCIGIENLVESNSGILNIFLIYLCVDTTLSKVTLPMYNFCFSSLEVAVWCFLFFILFICLVLKPFFLKIKSTTEFCLIFSFFVCAVGFHHVVISLSSTFLEYWVGITMRRSYNVFTILFP